MAKLRVVERREFFQAVIEKSGEMHIFQVEGAPDLRRRRPGQAQALRPLRTFAGHAERQLALDRTMARLRSAAGGQSGGPHAQQSQLAVQRHAPQAFSGRATDGCRIGGRTGQRKVAVTVRKSAYRSLMPMVRPT